MLAKLALLLLLVASLAFAASQATASHILVPKEDVAKSLMEQLKGGADFATLAREHSTCPSKAKGGSLGTFKPGQMVKEFNEAVFDKSKVGEVYGPVKTQFGYHLILVTDRKD